MRVIPIVPPLLKRSGVVGLGLNQLCMWFFVDVAGLHYLIAKLGATVIVTAWNYVTKRKVVKG
ncbi:MAG: GtrA family protein [Selenomonadaceae bacterium]|nr:GtrA family protein [Selenomonadaceae bacterium]